MIRHILRDLELTEVPNEYEYVSETEIYQFIIENCGYKQIADSLRFFFIRLAAKALSAELIKQDQYGYPRFEEYQIIDLLQDRDEREYHYLYEYYLGKQNYLEYHTINKTTYFFGENLKIEYNILIKTFAICITADLNRVLEKLKRHLSENVKYESWCELIVGYHGDDTTDVEMERIEEIINGVLG